MKGKRKLSCIVLWCVLCLFIGIGINNVEAEENYLRATDKIVFIDMQPIECYEINSETYIDAFDLKSYGFDVVWDEKINTLSITQNINASRSFINREALEVKRNSIIPSEYIDNLSKNNITVTMEGKAIPAYGYHEKALINIKVLSMFAFPKISDDGKRIEYNIIAAKLRNGLEFTKGHQEKYEKAEYDKEGNYIGSKEYLGIVKDGLPNGIGIMETDSFLPPYFKAEFFKI